MEVFENSWHIVIPDLKGQNVLNHHYICACGYKKKIALHNSHADFSYLKCPECGNNYYLDFETFRDKHIVRYWKEFHWSYECYKDKEGWHIHFYYNTPILKNSLDDFGAQKQSLQIVSLLYNGTVQVKTKDQKLTNCSIYNDDNTKITTMLDVQYASPLLRFVLKNVNETIAWIKPEKYTDVTDEQLLYILGFFLQNPHMKDEVLCFWDYKGCDKLKDSISSEAEGLSNILRKHHKKSIKRALYSNYTATKNSFYSPLFDTIVCTVFEDENYLVPLLNLNQHNKRELFKDFDLEEIREVFGFLQHYYSQKELFKLLLESVSVELNMSLFQDSIRMLRDEGDHPHYLEYFQKGPANLRTLHNELMRIQRRYIMMYRCTEVDDIFMPFDYPIPVLEMFTCVYQNLVFRLPRTPEELYNWANVLHNCMASYARDISAKRTQIIGVFKEDTLLYAIEIKNHYIDQVLGKYNQSIPNDDARVIQAWFRSLHVKTTVSENREVA